MEVLGLHSEGGDSINKGAYDIGLEDVYFCLSGEGTSPEVLQLIKGCFG